MKGFRWVIMFMLFLASLINYLDRSALAYTIIPLEQSFHLSNTQFGLIASAFGLSYVIMSIVGGLMVDRYGPRKILTFSSLLWSLAGGCIALTTGFASIFTCRIFLGMAEGPAFPSLTKVASTWLPAQERAKALALSLAAVPFSSVIGAPIVTHLIAAFGWRIMFLILGASGCLWALIWFIIFRNTPAESHLLSEQEKNYIESHLAKIPHSSTKTSILNILKNPNLFLAYIAYFCLGYLLAFSISWLPGFLQQTYNLPLTEVGWMLTLPWLLTTIFIVIGGICSDWLWNKTKCIRYSRTYVIATGQLISGLCLLPLVVGSVSAHMSLLIISLGLAFGIMPIAALYALNSDLALRNAGTSQGIMSSCLGVASFLAPSITGLLTTAEGNYSMAILVIVVLLLGSAMMLFGLHMQDEIKN